MSWSPSARSFARWSRHCLTISNWLTSAGHCANFMMRSLTVPAVIPSTHHTRKKSAEAATLKISSTLERQHLLDQSDKRFFLPSTTIDAAALNDDRHKMLIPT